jgi:hypothetical protein
LAEDGIFILSDPSIPVRGAPVRLADLTAPQRLSLASFTVGGLALRVWYQAGRSFDGDEVGTIKWIANGYYFLFTHFIDPWLTMPIYLMLERLLSQLTHQNAWVLVLPSLVASVATIPLVTALALRLTSAKAALLSGLLVAVNPYLLTYGVIIRSYSLMIVFTLAATLYLVDWMQSPGWRSGSACAFWVAMALLINANAVYQMPLFVVLVALWIWRRRTLGFLRANVRLLASLVVPIVGSAAVLWVAYAPVLDQMRSFAKAWTDTPPTSLRYLRELSATYLGDGQLTDDWYQVLRALPSLALIVVGVVGACGNHRLFVAILAVVLPPIAASMFGLAHYPWGYGRILIPMVPFLLVLLAEGIVRIGSWAAFVSLVAIASVLGTWIPNLAAQVAHKRDYPWDAVAARLAHEARSPDMLIADTAGRLTRFHLERFFSAGVEFTSPTDYLASPETPGCCRIFYISSDLAMDTSRPRQRMGKVEIVLYAGRSKRQVLQDLADDMRRSLSDRIDPALVGPYDLFLQLGAALEAPTDHVQHYRRLFEECRRRTMRELYMPAPQRRLLGISS